MAFVKLEDIPDASDKDLEFWFHKKSTETPEPKWKAANDKWLAAAKVELAKRAAEKKAGGPPRTAAAPTSTALAPVDGASLAITPFEQIEKMQGSYRDATKIAEMVSFLSKHANLIAPTSASARLPEGCEMSFSVVYVDPRDAKSGGETYTASGSGKALLKSGLMKISRAVGISWPKGSVVRLDDGKDPYLCEYSAAGVLIGPDGSEEELPQATVRVDLRKDDSPHVLGMQARKKDGDITVQLRERRMFLEREVESKAINNCVRKIGIKASFTDEDLRKPFVAMRVVFTGESDDPNIRAMFAKMIAARHLGGKEALYKAIESSGDVRADAGHQLSAPNHNLPHDPDGWNKQIVEAPQPQALPESAETVESPQETPVPTEQKPAPTSEKAPASPKDSGTPAPTEQKTMREPGDDGFVT